MKQMTFTMEEDGRIFLQVKGNITFQDIIRIAAVLMAKSAVKGLQEEAIREDEIEDFFRRTTDAARLTMKRMQEEE